MSEVGRVVPILARTSQTPSESEGRFANQRRQAATFKTISSAESSVMREMPPVSYLGRSIACPRLGGLGPFKLTLHSQLADVSDRTGALVTTACGEVAEPAETSARRSLGACPFHE